MTIGTTSYVDIGAIQRKEGSGEVPSTSYVDIGAAQRVEPVITTIQPQSMFLVFQ